MNVQFTYEFPLGSGKYVNAIQYDCANGKYTPRHYESVESAIAAYGIVNATLTARAFHATEKQRACKESDDVTTAKHHVKRELRTHEHVPVGPIIPTDCGGLMLVREDESEFWVRAVPYAYS